MTVNGYYALHSYCSHIKHLDENTVTNIRAAIPFNAGRIDMSILGLRNDHAVSANVRAS